MARGEGGGRIRKSAAPKLRIVGDDTELVVDESNPTATRMLPPLKPTRPEGMPDEVGALWDELADQLDTAGMLAGVDGPLLDLAVRSYLLAVDAADVVMHEGPLSTGSMGQVVAHPGAQAFRSNMAAYIEASKQLGLSFAARARIHVPEGKPDGIDAGNPFRGEASGQ